MKNSEAAETEERGRERRRIEETREERRRRDFEERENIWWRGEGMIGEGLGSTKTESSKS